MLLPWPYRASHPEDAKMGRLDRLVQRSRERKPEDFARIGRIDHTIVPQPRAREIGMTFALVLRAHGRLERGLLVCAPGTTLGVDGVTPDRGEYRRRLLPTHDRDPGVGPHPQEARVEGAPAHSVISGAVRPADNDRELGYPGAGNRGHHLRPVLGDPTRLVFSADHEAGDVLEEDEGDPALAAELDEMRGFERGLRVQHAVVGDDADRITA